MKAYEIRVTAPEDENDMASCSHYVDEWGDRAQDIIETIQRQFILKDDLVLESSGKVVRISESTEQGFFYTIYNDQKELEEGEDGIDGGLCNGSWGDAILMALDCIK